jgi:7-dehydrocholesterol reductase
MGLYWLGAYMGLYKGGILVDKLGEITSTINVFALGLCVFLYIKGSGCFKFPPVFPLFETTRHPAGLYFPSSADHGSTSNPVFDYYWGTELNPRLFGWDVKQMTNSRFGMIFWGLFMLAGILKQMETYGRVSGE